MDFWDVVESRKSVRSFESTPVPRELVERLIHAAGDAPSSLNSQPWRFHVTEGRSRVDLGEVVARATVHLKEFIDLSGHDEDEAIKWYSSLGDAPVVVAVSIPNSESEFDSVNKLLSVGGASENFMLAAAAEGLGTCNVTFAWWVRDALAEVCGIGFDRTIVSLIALGYPRGAGHPRPKRSSDIADWLG